MTQQAIPQRTLPAWTLENRAYLHAQLERLRLRLKRRVRWLRCPRGANPLPSYSSMVISEVEADCLLEAGERESELRFYCEDPEASALGRELADAEGLLADLEQRLEQAEQPAAVQQLALDAHFEGVGGFLPESRRDLHRRRHPRCPAA